MDRLLLLMLKARSRELIRRFPQVACFAFDYISTEIAVRGRFERAELQCFSSQIFNRLKKRRICLDVGANIGNHSLAFAEHFDRVLAFEPNPRTFKLLAINSELARNVVPYRLGASNRKGTVTAYQDALNIGGATSNASISDLRERNEHGVISAVQFDVDRLDDMLNPSDLNQIDFIKLDVEGHEAAALEGMETILRASGPIVAMEAFSSSFRDGQSASVEILRSHDYAHFYGLDDGRENPRLPRFIRKLRKRIRKLVGPGTPRYTLKKIDAVAPGFPHMLICSKIDLIETDADGNLTFALSAPPSHSNGDALSR